jgi:hypothetical protein
MAIFKYNPYKRKSTACSSSTATKRRRFAVRGKYTVPVYKTVNMTAPSNKVELKMDYGAANITVTNTGTVTLLTTIPSGSDWNERIGRLINYHSVQMKYHLTKLAGHDAEVVTLSLVYDKQTNSTLPGFTDIFQSAVPDTFVKSTNRNRFEILWQKTHSTSNGTTGQWNVSPNGTCNKNLKGKKATFVGTSDTISDIDSGAIYLTTITGNSSSAIGLDSQNIIMYHE